MTEKSNNEEEGLKVEIPKPDLAQKIKKTYESFIERPHATLETALLILLLISFAAVIITWIWITWLPDTSVHDQQLIELNKERLKIPLILFGATTISLLVMTTGKGIALLISVIVIGTIVAQEHFLLRVVHMLSKTDVPIGSYFDSPKGLPGKVDANARMANKPDTNNLEWVDYTINALQKEIIQTVGDEVGIAALAAAKTINTIEDPKKFAEQVADHAVKLTEGKVKSIVTNRMKTAVIGTDAATPEEARRNKYLEIVVKQYMNFDKVAEKYGNLTDFSSDMLKLKRDGYINCTSDEWASCFPTDKGRDFIIQQPIEQGKQ